MKSSRSNVRTIVRNMRRKPSPLRTAHSLVGPPLVPPPPSCKIPVHGKWLVGKRLSFETSSPADQLAVYRRNSGGLVRPPQYEPSVMSCLLHNPPSLSHPPFLLPAHHHHQNARCGIISDGGISRSVRLQAHISQRQGRSTQLISFPSHLDAVVLPRRGDRSDPD